MNTLSYSMAFWGETEWRNELDWLALNGVNVVLDVTKLPSAVHKYGALNNKAVVFDDRRKRKPKYKPNYMED